MKIGIIGVGPIGGTLAKKWVAAGHSVKIANSRGPETLAEQEKTTGATAVKIEDAVKNVDVIVVSIPFQAVAKLPTGLFAQVPKEVVVIDTCNYYPEFRDARVEALDKLTQTESDWVAQQIGRPVTKVFNNITQHSLDTKGVPAGTEGRIALPVSGDDANAKKIVFSLLNDIGFDAFDAGTIAESWQQQPGFPGYGTDLTLKQLPAGLAGSQRDRLPELRALSVKKMMEKGFNFKPEELIQMFRETFTVEITECL